MIDSHKHLHTGNGVQRGSFASTTRWFSDNFPDARCGKLSRDNDATWQIWCNQTCSCKFRHCPNPTLTRTISKPLGKKAVQQREKLDGRRSLNTHYLCVSLYDVSPSMVYTWLNYTSQFSAIRAPMSWRFRKRCEGGETTRHTVLEAEVNTWKEKSISKRTCGGEWVGNIKFTPGTVALLFSWSGFKQCGLHATCTVWTFPSHLNLSPYRKVAWQHTWSVCQIKVWKLKCLCWSWSFIGWLFQVKANISFMFFQENLFNYILWPKKNPPKNRSKEQEDIADYIVSKDNPAVV